MEFLFGSLTIFMLTLLPVQAQIKSLPSQTNSVQAAITVDRVFQTIQVISVAVGVGISVLSFNSSQKNQAESRKFEAAKPFLELRQKFYLEAVHTAAVLSNPKDHTPDEIASAKKKFCQLYVAELSLVEAKDVEQKMIDLAQTIAPELKQLSPEQRAAYKLAHALRDSLRKSWNFDESTVDNL